MSFRHPLCSKKSLLRDRYFDLRPYRKCTSSHTGDGVVTSGNGRSKAEAKQVCIHSVTFLGHRIDADCTRFQRRSKRSKMLLPTPKSVTELKVYVRTCGCWLTIIYGKFMPNMAKTLHPLCELLHKNTLYRRQSKNKLFRLQRNYCRRMNVDPLWRYPSTHSG